MRSDSSKAIDATVRLLARDEAFAGFQRRGRWLIKAVGDVFHCAWLQSSLWNTPTEADFALNLHVVWPPWEELWSGGAFTGAQYADPVASARLGFLAYGRDHWWRVGAQVEAAGAAQSISQAFRSHGLPFFAPFGSSEQLLAALDAGGALPVAFHRRLLHAALLARAGRYEEAAAFVRAEREAQPSWERVGAFAERLGLDAA